MRRFDGDREAFWLTLKDVAKDRQTMTAKVMSGDITIQPLQRSLGNGEAPTLESLVVVLSSMGLQSTLSPTESAKLYDSGLCG
ncbi:hypothetical protein C7293_11415 [filamentous cyanobacterium CCT1]|nr:hypothetical protein C7293_11415 [filamentous cyanobacterium CCT1]PSN78199.1 hypothetical protein C8B47_18095 [filamentous cyanobacterium CCP4]